MSDLSSSHPTRGWVRDPTAGWLGIGFLVLLLGSEGALTLPDSDASAASVADFYAQHGTAIVSLQVVGFVACLLLGLFAWRVRVDDPRLAASGVLLAVLAAAPGAVTTVLAVVADPARPAQAGRLNDVVPRADDLLFVGIVLFAGAVVASAASPGWMRGLGAVVATLSGVRLVMDLAGADPGPWESLAPLAFLVLVAAMVLLVFRGKAPGAPTTAGRGPVPRGRARRAG